MVEINNQRAVPRYAGVVEGMDNGRQKTRNRIWCTGGELFTDYLDHPRKLVTLNPKLKSTGAGRYQLLSVMDAYRKQLGLKDFSPKSQDAVALQQIKERGALPWLIVVISVRHRPLQQYLGFTAGRWLWLRRAWADSLIAKFKEGRNGQRDWCMSRVTAIISALVICIIVCLSWAVNHYRDNAITYKAQRDKNARELEAGERGNYWHADASAWCCCARCKIHEGVSWC